MTPCDCTGTAHDLDCWTFRRVVTPAMEPSPTPDDQWRNEVLRELRRIAVLLEEIAGRRR